MIAQAKPGTGKNEWGGRIMAIQPRIRLLRSFDERSHSYLGYVLRVEGTIGDEPGEFRINWGSGRANLLKC